jgi:hypothetical protein
MIALSLVLALAAPAAVKDDAAPDIPAALRVRWTQHFEAVRDFLYVTDDGQVIRSKTRSSGLTARLQTPARGPGLRGTNGTNAGSYYRPR